MNLKAVRSVARMTAHRTRETIVRALYRSPLDARRSLSPSVERGPQGLLRVHIGCGTIVLPGWFNVDERWFPHVHQVGSADCLDSLPDGAAESLYASHILEHVSHPRLPSTLKEWARVLAPGGRMFLAVPDFDKLLDRYLARGRNVEEIEGPLMGQQNYEANTHRAVFNRARLARLMTDAGLEDIQDFRGEEILGATLWDNSKHEVSLNLTARKP